jgi:hypothetical protein
MIDSLVLVGDREVWLDPEAAGDEHTQLLIEAGAAMDSSEYLKEFMWRDRALTNLEMYAITASRTHGLAGLVLHFWVSFERWIGVSENHGNGSTVGGQEAWEVDDAEDGSGVGVALPDA